MKRNLKGAAIAQYAIIIVLIALGCLAAYTILGKTIVDKLSGFLGVQNDINTHLSENTGSSSTTSTATALPGSLGGTTAAPQEDCTGSMCTVDYGDFILTGVPENYQDFVEAQGTSGGTDKLVSVINQLADQLEADGDLAEAQQLRDFANLLAFMGDSQSNIESIASSCAASATPNQCLQTAMQTVTINCPAILNTILPDFNSDSLYSLLSSQLDVGSAAYSVFNNIADADVGGSSSDTLYQLFKDIQSNPQFSDSIKDVITQTYSAAALSSTTLSHNTRYLSTTDGSNVIVMPADPLTGTISGLPFETIQDVDYNEIQHPPAADNPALNIP